jgi:hypothetical protein
MAPYIWRDSISLHPRSQTVSSQRSHTPSFDSGLQSLLATMANRALSQGTRFLPIASRMIFADAKALPQLLDHQHRSEFQGPLDGDVIGQAALHFVGIQRIDNLDSARKPWQWSGTDGRVAPDPADLPCRSRAGSWRSCSRSRDSARYGPVGSIG